MQWMLCSTKLTTRICVTRGRRKILHQDGMVEVGRFPDESATECIVDFVIVSVMTKYRSHFSICWQHHCHHNWQSTIPLTCLTATQGYGGTILYNHYHGWDDDGCSMYVSDPIAVKSCQFYVLSDNCYFADMSICENDPLAESPPFTAGYGSRK